ncbi:MAG: ACT domain-containing protein [Bacteroidota bacterium]
MSAETDLRKLLRELKPHLHRGEYVFVSLAPERVAAIPPASIIGSFREAEGITLILSREAADQRKLRYDYVAAWITLEVHSSLAAVGLTAAFATALAAEGISGNVVAGFYHDHLFVGVEQAERALEILRTLGKE